MNIFKSKIVYIIILVAAALFLRYYLVGFLNDNNALWVRIAAIVFILLIGAFFVLKKIAEVIEETTEVLSKRTKIASGLLQSLGTAFPDMILGIMAAILSLRLVKSDYNMAINFAIIAAATTFGSNIYNIGHAAWCVFRQNIANKKEKSVPMLPGVKMMGTVIPMKEHIVKPDWREIDESANILNVLTILTAITAISMVIFGKVSNPAINMKGDLYSLIKPVGFFMLVLCIITMYYFRKTKRKEILVEDVQKEEKYYSKKATWFILLNLVLAGIAILFAAESMVLSIEVFCAITKVPFVIAGVLAGVIGCMGEMIVVHNFTVNPKGRIGDALVGVAMDNIVTIMGASIVAVMGGIFLGGNALILIFVITLSLNSILLWQILGLKSFFLN
jgi:hypothetical protein